MNAARETQLQIEGEISFHARGPATTILGYRIAVQNGSIIKVLTLTLLELYAGPIFKTKYLLHDSEKRVLINLNINIATLIL